MRICRFDDNRLGLVEAGKVFDVSDALDLLPPLRWPQPLGDQLIENLDLIKIRIAELRNHATAKPLSEVRLLSPVANPSKIIGAPINYQKHIEEADTDAGLITTRPASHIADWGLFLKANSALVGPGEGISLRFLEARNDHEVELAVVIGRRGSAVPTASALDHVAGYAIGLDITTRGTELQSFRKSPDSYAVIGPWLVTAEEIQNPDNLDLGLKVNGEVRQRSNTRNLVYDVATLISYASARYTLYPGDIIMTGTPEGVGPIEPGDLLSAWLQEIGQMEVRVN
jgi:2-keto-4-pentenoate hydratase/2-oxohepta-3-ene-1,7-dioic acid hydratase in catechol pathway